MLFLDIFGFTGDNQFSVITFFVDFDFSLQKRDISRKNNDYFFLVIDLWKKSHNSKFYDNFFRINGFKMIEELK